MTGLVTAYTHPALAAASRPGRSLGSAGPDAPILAAATGAGLKVPVTGLPGPGRDHGPENPAPTPARCPPGPAGTRRVVNRIRRYLAGRVRRAGALPGYGAAVAAALAGAWADPPWWLYHRLNLPPRARAHPVVSGGLPGWQITLLLAAAALLAAAIAVTVSQRRAGGGAPRRGSPDRSPAMRNTPIQRSRQMETQRRRRSSAS